MKIKIKKLYEFKMKEEQCIRDDKNKQRNEGGTKGRNLAKGQEKNEERWKRKKGRKRKK